MPSKLTAEQISAMKHAIGMYGDKKPYTRQGKQFYRPWRNRYFTYPQNPVWSGLESKGYADHGEVRKRVHDGETHESTEFWLTRAGLDKLGEELGVTIYDESD